MIDLESKQNKTNKQRENNKQDYYFLTSVGPYKTVKTLTGIIIVIIIITIIGCCLATNAGEVTKLIRTFFNSSIFLQILSTSL